MRKVFLVIDQLPASTFKAGIHRLKLPFIPRTTPVGHATLSMGALPHVHGVQGREWYRNVGGTLVQQKIDALPTATTPPGWRPKTLAAKLRSNGASGIVISAAKAFLPFLFGAWDADVAVYPTTIAPSPVAAGGPQPKLLVVRAKPFTQAGDFALRSSVTQLLTLFQTLALLAAPSSIVTSRWHSSGAFEILWWVDDLTKAAWATLVDAHGPAIDTFYTDATLELLQHLGNSAVHVQSWFSTDFRGHRHGVGSKSYLQAVGAALSTLRRLQGQASIVVATSDHGGRLTPQKIDFDSRQPAPRAVTRGTSQVALPSAQHVVMSGDHLSSATTPRPPPVRPSGSTQRRRCKPRLCLWDFSNRPSRPSRPQPGWCCHAMTSALARRATLPEVVTTEHASIRQAG